MEDIPLDDDETTPPSPPTDTSSDRFEIVSPRGTQFGVRTDVSEWLRALDLKQYATAFDEFGFDRMSILPEITEDHLIEMKVKPGHRLVILKACAQLRETPHASTSSALSASTNHRRTREYLETVVDEETQYLRAMSNETREHRPHAQYAKYLFTHGRKQRAKLHAHRALERLTPSTTDSSSGSISSIRSISDASQFEDLSFMLGQLYYSDGVIGFGNARLHLSKCLEVNPQHFEAHFLMGLIEYLIGSEVRMSTSKNVPMSQTVGSIVTLTKTYDAVRWFQSARYHFEQAVSNYNRTRLRAAESDANAVEMDQKDEYDDDDTDDVEFADNNNNEAIPLGFCDAQYHWGVVLVDLSEFIEAETHFRLAMEIDPFFSNARLALARLLVTHLERYDEAEEILLKSISMDKTMRDWESHLIYANLLHINLKRFDEAFREYNIALSINPNSAEAHFQMGHMLKNEMGRDEDAERHYEKGIELDPQNPARFVVYQQRVVTFASNLFHRVASAVDTAVDSVRKSSVGSQGEAGVQPPRGPPPAVPSSRDRSGSMGSAPPMR